MMVMEMEVVGAVGANRSRSEPLLDVGGAKHHAELRVIGRRLLSDFTSATLPSPDSNSTGLSTMAAAPNGMVLVQVLVPPGVSAGQQLQLESPYGGRFAVTVPPGVSAGQMMHVHVPGPASGSLQQMAPPTPPAPGPVREEEVDQLAAMFPDMDREVLVLILETSGGGMEEAIGQLLELCSEADGTTTPPVQSPASAPSPASTPHESQMDADERLARQLAGELQQQSNADERLAHQLAGELQQQSIDADEELAIALQQELAARDGGRGGAGGNLPSSLPRAPPAVPAGAQQQQQGGLASGATISVSRMRPAGQGGQPSSSSRVRPSTAKLRALKETLKQKKEKMQQRRGGKARGGRQGAEDGTSLLGGGSADADLEDEAALGGGTPTSQPHSLEDDDAIPTITREQWERDFGAGTPSAAAAASPPAAAGGAGAATVVAEPVPVDKYNSRVARAKLANTAKRRQCSVPLGAGGSTPSSQPASQPATPTFLPATPTQASPPEQPLTTGDVQVAMTPAAAAPANLMD